MINYTERISLLMDDIVSRVEALSFIDTKDILVFARFGRTGAEGAYATCHSLNLPTSEPGYFFWRDRETGLVTRRSKWFVTKTPEVVLGGKRIEYLVSFSLPRFCDQSLDGARKAVHYPNAEPWLAKLDTVVHELYHIDPDDAGIRRLERPDGRTVAQCHTPAFFENVARFVQEYLASGAKPEMYEFLQYDFDELTERYGGVVGTTFRNFPSFPQRYQELLEAQPEIPASVNLVPLKVPSQPTRYNEDDLCIRHFTEEGCRRLTMKGRHRAA